MEIKTAYEQLAKKYTLPKYDELDGEFELLYVQNILEIRYVLRFVRRRMTDKFAWVCNMIQSFLQPNPSSFVSLQESSFFNPEEKKAMGHLLKDLMQYARVSVALDIEGNDKNDAENIKAMHEKWIHSKPELLVILKKLPAGWKEVHLAKEAKEEQSSRNHYLG